MSSINLHTREISIKVVYYGPGLCGKTTSLQHIHRTLKPELRGQLVSLATGIDRTLYFDFLPIKLPKVKGFNIRMSLYTVPGQVHYNATRKLVLQGCDGVVFVADSQIPRRGANIESLANLGENLQAQGMNIEQTPLIFQFNKRDLPDLMSIEQMNKELNPRALQNFETCALTGKGIFDSLKTIAKLVLSDLKRKGIYQDKPAPSTPTIESAPVVSPSVESGLVAAIERQKDLVAAKSKAKPEKGATESLSFSKLWPAGEARKQILDMEKSLKRGEYKTSNKLANKILNQCVQGAETNNANPVEMLLMLGVYGPHFSRFRKAVDIADPSREDALFCLFFLADVELRMQAVGLRT
ncbi:MAG: hypothetical protein JRF33_18640 [Deltaproteobacteria bacterium]|nr:hypothetical protein [Deltaproteobacteria bacterium]